MHSHSKTLNGETGISMDGVTIKAMVQTWLMISQTIQLNGLIPMRMDGATIKPTGHLKWMTSHSFPPNTGTPTVMVLEIF